MACCSAWHAARAVRERLSMGRARVWLGVSGKCGACALAVCCQSCVMSTRRLVQSVPPPGNVSHPGERPASGQRGLEGRRLKGGSRGQLVPSEPGGLLSATWMLGFKGHPERKLFW